MLLQPYNIAKLMTDGVDIEASYRFSVGDDPGAFVVRALATNVRRFIDDPGLPGTIPVDSAGANTGVTPDWKILASQTYSRDRWSVTLSERWISSGVFDNNYVQCNPGSCPLPTTVHPTINYNHVPSSLYLRLSGSYKFNDNFEAYFKVDNLTDLAPRAAPTSTTPNDNGVNSSLYDTVGRMYGLGLRMRM